MPFLGEQTRHSLQPAEMKKTEDALADWQILSWKSQAAAIENQRLHFNSFLTLLSYRCRSSIFTIAGPSTYDMWMFRIGVGSVVNFTPFALSSVAFAPRSIVVRQPI